MRILIVGSGAIGGLIGARLVEQGHEVEFVVGARRKVQLLTTGLVLSSHYGRFRRPVAAITADELRSPSDLVLVTCRAQDYEATVPRLAPAIGPDTLVLPLLDGASQLRADLIPNGGHLVNGVLQARVSLDADGVLHQRKPAAEVRLGAMRGGDAERLVALFACRGLQVSVIENGQGAVWARFCFAAAAVAINALTAMSIRDAVRPTHLITSFDRMMQEAADVGTAVGVSVRMSDMTDYRRAYRLETRPVQPPPLLNEGGRGADEAVFLLLSMVDIAERARVPVPRLRAARDALVRPRDVTLTATDVSDEEAA